MTDFTTTPSVGRPRMHPDWCEPQQPLLPEARLSPAEGMTEGEPGLLWEAFPAERERQTHGKLWVALLGAALGFGLLAALWAPAANAQARPPCHNAAEIRAKLADKYNEQPVAFGLQTNGNLLQVYASEAGTWTLISERPGGVACIIAAGEGWEQLPLRQGTAAAF